MFPTYLLNKVYLTNSLKKTEKGFSFTLKNMIDTGTLGGVKSMTVDGEEVQLDAILLETPQGRRSAAEISPRNSLPLYVNAEATVLVMGHALTPGSHHIILTLYVMEAGTLSLTIDDVVS